MKKKLAVIVAAGLAAAALAGCLGCSGDTCPPSVLPPAASRSASTFTARFRGVAICRRSGLPLLLSAFGLPHLDYGYRCGINSASACLCRLASVMAPACRFRPASTSLHRRATHAAHHVAPITQYKALDQVATPTGLPLPRRARLALHTRPQVATPTGLPLPQRASCARAWMKKLR